MNTIKECVIELLFQKEKEKDKNNKLLDPFSETKIIIRIYDYNGQCTMHILYFFFHAHDYMIIEKFTKKKNQELIKFKNMIENYKQKMRLNYYYLFKGNNNNYNNFIIKYINKHFYNSVNLYTIQIPILVNLLEKVINIV